MQEDSTEAWRGWFRTDMLGMDGYNETFVNFVDSITQDKDDFSKTDSKLSKINNFYLKSLATNAYTHFLVVLIL